MFGLVYRRIVMVMLLAALLLFPLIARGPENIELMALGTTVVAIAIAAVGLDFLAGYAGMVALCQASFVAIGATVTAAFARATVEGAEVVFLGLPVPGITNAFIVWPLAAGIAAGVAFLFGVFAVRARGASFVLVTLIGAQLFFFGLRGPDGEATSQTMPGPSTMLGILNLGDAQVFYGICAVSLLAALILCHRLAHCGYGLVLRAAREDEPRVRALGHGVRRHRLLAFVVAGALGGWSGALLVNVTREAGSAMAHWTESAELLVMVLIGGPGTLVGAVIGTVLYTALQAILSAWFQEWLILLAGALLGLVLLLPRGLYGTARGRIGDA